jgi:hypothetical protein
VLVFGCQDGLIPPFSRHPKTTAEGDTMRVRAVYGRARRVRGKAQQKPRFLLIRRAS